MAAMPSWAITPRSGRQLAASLIEADITYKIAQDAVRDILDLPDPDEEEY